MDILGSSVDGTFVLFPSWDCYEFDAFVWMYVFRTFHFEKNFFNVYLFLMGRRNREWETQKPKQVPGSELSAQSKMQGLNSQTIRS